MRPGQFQIDSVPVISGAGQAQMVITDINGRSRVVDFALYSTSQLLQDGLTDWSGMRDQGLAATRQLARRQHTWLRGWSWSKPPFGWGWCACDGGRGSNPARAEAAGGKRLAHKVDIEDLSQATHDPLLARMRARLRKEHGAPREGKPMRIPCVFSREAVAAPDASCSVDGGDGTLNCHGYGSVVSVTATFGQCAAGWVLERIATSARI